MDAVPETFVDRFGEVSFRNGMIRIELVSLSGPEPRVVERLIMSVQAFMQMQQVQRELVAQLQSSGVIRAVQPPGPGPQAVPEPASLAPPAPEPTPRPAGMAPPKSPNFPNC